jgi:hypothetical protein
LPNKARAGNGAGAWVRYALAQSRAAPDWPRWGSMLMDRNETKVPSPGYANGSGFRLLHSRGAMPARPTLLYPAPPGRGSQAFTCRMVERLLCRKLSRGLSACPGFPVLSFARQIHMTQCRRTCATTVSRPTRTRRAHWIRLAAPVLKFEMDS